MRKCSPVKYSENDFLLGNSENFFRVFDTSSFIFYYRTVYPDNLNQNSLVRFLLVLLPLHSKVSKANPGTVAGVSIGIYIFRRGFSFVQEEPKGRQILSLKLSPQMKEICELNNRKNLLDDFSAS